MDITRLCSTTNWIEGNIGYKYLKVFRYVMKKDVTDGYDTREQLSKYEVFAQIVQKLFSLLQDRICIDGETL